MLATRPSAAEKQYSVSHMQSNKMDTSPSHVCLLRGDSETFWYWTSYDESNTMKRIEFNHYKLCSFVHITKKNILKWLRVVLQL